MIRFEVTQQSISAEVKKEKPVDMVVQDTVILKIQGKSAYEVALENGFEGTEEDWLESLKGEPGADGFSPSVAVSDIDGGHRVTITDKDGAKAFDVMDGKDGEGGSGGGKAIIDVVELPTENINEDVFYRLLTGTFVFNQFAQSGWTCYCVDTLPETGEPVTPDMVSVTAYYNVADGDVYGYINDMLAAQAGVPVGWYPLSTLAPLFGVAWGGVITDIMDDPADDILRLLLESVVCYYKDEWVSMKIIGASGTGASAEVFNHPSNKATGDSSHAEGYASHAEGGSSHAEGYASHAEGGSSHAEGDCSHAEGYYSHAEGDYSHAEGDYSHAVGRSQHAQGEYNEIDPEYNADTPGMRGKYAHIVGNGTSSTSRSNAHTLDWNGLGWFSCGLKVGGTGQDDPAAEEIPTKAQVQKMVDDATVSWNDVEGKPVVMVGGSDTLTWDGNTEGLLAVEVPMLGNTFYKVADTVLTQKDVWGEDNSRYEIARVDWGDDYSFTAGSNDELMAITDDIMRQCTDGEQGYYDGVPIVFYIDKAICTMVDNFQLGDVVFPEAGVYFAADTHSLYILDFNRFNAQEKIAPSHLYQPDWEQMDESAPDFLKNKPFGEMPTGGDTLYWDGNTEGLLEVVSDAGTWYKVSDVVPTEDEVFCRGADDSAEVVLLFDGGEQGPTYPVICLEQVFNDLGAVGAFEDNVICALTDNYEVPALETTFPEKGIYFRSSRITINSFRLPNCTKFPSTKQMDKKYLPMSDITAAVLAALPIYNGEVEEV